MSTINLVEQFVGLFGTGIVAMGLTSWIGGDDGMEDGLEPDGGEALFDDASGGDEFGGMDGGNSGDGFGGMDDGSGGDEFGGMDSGSGGDGFGGMDDWDDDFGDSGGSGGGQAMQMVEGRVDDLQTEVEQISSTMNTVRSENEEIATRVEEVEENVRKLLEIYEMVTRGVNPFVDDVSGGAMGGSASGGGDFGLFDNDSTEDADDEEELDEDVAGADAESFFDDDAFDEFEEDAEDDFGGVDESEDDAGGFDGEDDADDETDGTTFQDLKAEYESGEADWAADELDESGAGEDDPADENDPADEFEYSEPIDPESGSDGTQPYLSTLPSSYVVDLVVMEWLDYLVAEFDAANAAQAITYYGRINWISDSVEERLMNFLQGFADVDTDAIAGGPVEMDIDDHIRSLTFISKLTGDSVDRQIIEHCTQRNGVSRGIQR